MLLIQRLGVKGASTSGRALLPHNIEKHSQRNVTTTNVYSGKILQKKRKEKDESENTNKTSVPSTAKVVICGGGLMGSSVAYHLSLQGLGKHTVTIFFQ